MRKIILLSLVIAVLAAFFASAHPDGLEKVAEGLGFIDRGVERHSLMTDYSVPFITREAVSTAVAGFIGILMTLGLFAAVPLLLKRKSG